MPRHPLDVAIVGAGTAGTAAGLLLARAGHTVTLYERVPDPSPVGAGIVLQPTGQAVLARLGLLAPIQQRAAPIDRLRCVTGRGRTVFALDYATVAPKTAVQRGLGLHRGVLFETLLHAARDQADLDLRCGLDIVGHETNRHGVFVRCADGIRHGPHDLLIVADGARSAVRNASDVPYRETPYPWGALWYVASDPERLYRDELFQVVRGARSMLGLLPTGYGPDPTSPPLVSLFWSLRVDQLDAFRRGDFSAWKASIERDDPRAAGVLASLTDPGQLLFARYRHIEMPRWHDDRIVLLGDAAHAMSPQLGQGCNLALVDAAILADSLATAPLPVALAHYSAARRAHLRYYLWATRWLTPFFQSDQDWLGSLRDVFMPLATKIPWLRTLMARSMSGTVRGIVRPPLSLAMLRGGDCPAAK